MSDTSREDDYDETMNCLLHCEDDRESCVSGGGSSERCEEGYGACIRGCDHTLEPD